MKFVTTTIIIYLIYLKFVKQERRKISRSSKLSQLDHLFRNTSSNYNSSKVISYINVRLSQFCFSLQKDIFNHRDISCVSFFNNGSTYFLINIYSNSSQTALKYLKNTKANINNILVMAEDFNIRDNS